MDAVIRKWGNSLAVRLPMPVINAVHFRLEQKVDISVKDGRIIIEPLHKPTYSLDELLTGMTAENGHGEVDFGKPAGKESF